MIRSQSTASRSWYALAFLASIANVAPGAEVLVESTIPGRVCVDGNYTGRNTPTTLMLNSGSFTIGLGGRNNRYQEQSVVVGNDPTAVHFRDENWLPPRSWRLVMIAVRDAELRPGIEARLSDADILNAYVSLVETNAKWVVPFSYGLAEWDIHALVVQGTRGYVPGNWDQLNAGRLLQDAGLKQLEQEFDVLFFMWPSIPDAGYGNLPDIFRGQRGVGGGAHFTIPNNCFRSYAGPSEMLLHEWLHVVEGHYRSIGFSMGEEGLHGGERHGYRKGVEGDWLHWYRPFMRAQVRENGRYVGVPPTAWKASTRLRNKPAVTMLDRHKGLYRLISAASGKALDVADRSTDTDVGLVQHQYTGSPSQHWRLEPAADDYVLIVNDKSGHAIDVPQASNEDGIQLIQWHRDPGRFNQQWKIEREGLFSRIRSRSSDLVMDVDHASQANGAQVVQWGAHEGKNQLWLLLPVLSPDR